MQGGYGGQQQSYGQPPSYEQSQSYGGGQEDYSGAPQAPEAPPLGDLGNYNPGRAPQFNQGGGGYGGGQQQPQMRQQQYGGQQSPDRSNMLSQIRGYQRTPAAQGGGGYGGQQQMQPQSYGAPEAPPLGDLANYSPSRNSAPVMSGQGGGSNRFGMSSSAHPARGNMFDEIRGRGGEGRMGLRPAQTRASSAYPRNESDDFMGRMMAQRRNAIEPSRPQGNLSSGRY